MTKHYQPQSKPNIIADCALSIFIGITLAYLLFIYL